MRTCQLQAINLSCIRQQKLLFARISFQLKSGEALLIQGPNGSGKSSLLRLLTSLATPASGEIFWNAQPIQESRIEYFKQLHYIGHANGIKWGLTVEENVQLLHHLSSSNAPDIDPVLTSLQLCAYKNTLAGNLSAGQKRRLALAKLFLAPKTVWILDEPLTALDIDSQILFLLHFEKHLKRGGIGIISSHHSIDFKEIFPQRLRLG